VLLFQYEPKSESKDKILIKIVDVKYQKNPSSGFRASQCEEKSGYGEANGRFYKLLNELNGGF
jgi:hypothetical protein